MNVIVSTDWHPDASTAGFARFGDVELAVDASVERAIELQSKTPPGRRLGEVVYVFLGDLITNDPALHLMIRCLGLAQRAIRRLATWDIPSIWLPGNHDVFEDGFGTTVIDPLHDIVVDAGEGKIQGSQVVRDPALLTLSPGKRAIFLPFTPTTRAYDPVTVVEKFATETDPDEVVLVAGHLMIEGIGPGSETNDMPRGRDVFFPVERVRQLFRRAVMANGHYHRQQVFNGVHIPGTLPFTQGERGNQAGYLELGL